MDSTVHKVVGVTAGVVGVCRLCIREQRTLDFPQFFVACLGGLVGGCLADKLEPATNPWHRGPAHSVPVGILLIQAAGAVSDLERCPQVLRSSDLLRVFVTAFLWGYLSHLALDLATANGLPGFMPGKGLSVYPLLTKAA